MININKLKEICKDEMERKIKQFEEEKQRLIDTLQKTDIWRIECNIDTRDVEKLIKLSVEVRTMKSVLSDINHIEKGK